MNLKPQYITGKWSNSKRLRHAPATPAGCWAIDITLPLRLKKVSHPHCFAKCKVSDPEEFHTHSNLHACARWRPLHLDRQIKQIKHNVLIQDCTTTSKTCCNPREDLSLTFWTVCHLDSSKAGQILKHSIIGQRLQLGQNLLWRKVPAVLQILPQVSRVIVSYNATNRDVLRMMSACEVKLG